VVVVVDTGSAAGGGSTGLGGSGAGVGSGVALGAGAATGASAAFFFFAPFFLGLGFDFAGASGKDSGPAAAAIADVERIAQAVTATSVCLSMRRVLADDLSRVKVEADEFALRSRRFHLSDACTVQRTAQAEQPRERCHSGRVVACATPFFLK
jgi:hypothetical protein